MLVDPSAAPPTKVFVSYAHDSAVDGHRERALRLAQALRRRGLDAVIDQYVEHDPPAFWPRWMMDEIKAADFVLCLASPAYKKRAELREDRESVGRGVRWEGAIITEEIYGNVGGSSKKFISVVLEGCSYEDIPDVLFPIGRPFYVLPADSAILYHRLTGVPRVVPQKLGPVIKPPLDGFSDSTSYFGVRDDDLDDPCG